MAKLTEEHKSKSILPIITGVLVAPAAVLGFIWLQGETPVEHILNYSTTKAPGFDIAMEIILPMILGAGIGAFFRQVSKSKKSAIASTIMFSIIAGLACLFFELILWIGGGY